VLVALAMRTLPLSEREKQDQANTLTMLDSNLLVTPDIAIDQANTAVTLLSKTVGDAFLSVIGSLADSSMAEEVDVLCERSDKYRTQIEEYILQISECDIDREGRAYLKLISTANTAFGRMGILAERMLEMIDKFAESTDESTEEEEREINILGDSIFEIMQLTINGYTSKANSISQTIRCYREEIMELAAIVKNRYIRKIHEKGLEMNPESLFADISHIHEQLIDYCDMIADAMIRYNAAVGEEEQADTGTDESIRKHIHRLFEDKYEVLGIKTGSND
jgi:phosphate:Na+ symporter